MCACMQPLTAGAAAPVAGSNMLAGAVSWFAGATLWVTSLSYVRRNYFEVSLCKVMPWHGKDPATQTTWGASLTATESTL